MYNKVTLVGNLGKDPETRQVNEQSCSTFSLATSESYKDKNGEWQTKTEWHNIVTWKHTADFVAKHLQKGKTVLIEGKIKYRSWQDRDGRTVYATDIHADTVRLLDKKEKDAPMQSQEDTASDLPF